MSGVSDRLRPEVRDVAGVNRQRVFPGPGGSAESGVGELR